MTTLMESLQSPLSATILVATHFPAESRSFLPLILSRAGPMPARHAVDAETVETGRIYVGPPGQHLVLRDGKLALLNSARQHGERPAIDVLFRSAAFELGRRTIGVLLSGLLDDGVAGLAAIRKRGGVTIVQEPADASYPDMPRAAIDAGVADHVLPAAEIAACLGELISIPVIDDTEPILDDPLVYEVAVDRLEAHTVETDDPPGEPSTFTCPACGGSLWQKEEGNTLHFRCYVGHAYAPAALDAAQAQRLERALWVSLRTLAETAKLSERLGERMSGHGAKAIAERYRRRAEEARETAGVLRELLLHPRPPLAD